MARVNHANFFIGRNRVSVLLIVILILFSSLTVFFLNVAAQEDNVYVDGYVLESGSGFPIDNASVILQNTWDGTTNITKTNSTGYYNLSIYAPPGGANFVITAFHEDYLIGSVEFWLQPANPQNWDLYLDRALNKNSYVHGEVLDAVTMAPLPFTGVAALGDNYINTTSSNSTGYFWMALESDQTYYIRTDTNGYESQTKSSYLRVGDNRTFNFYLEPLNCTLMGYIKNPGGPLGFASVHVYKLNEEVPTEYWPDVNSSTGYFKLNLTRGVWQVEVQEGMHYSQTISVLMFNDQTTWQNFTLNKLPLESATIQGYVRYYHNGSGAPWASINAQNKNRTWNGYNTSDGTGWYTMTVLPDEISVDAWLDRYGTKQTSITTQDGGTYYLNLSLVDWWSTGYIEGYVRHNGTGEPDVGITVSYGNWRYDDRTDLSGYYNVSVPGAPVEIHAYKDGFKYMKTQVNTTAYQTTVQDFDLELLDWCCELRGYLNNTNNEPLEAAYASFDYDGYGWQSATAVTDYTGFYQRMAPVGDASYFIFADSHEYKVGNVNLLSDQIFWFNETLDPVKDDATIICSFKNICTNEPIKHATITISEQDLKWFSDVETDENGMIRMAVPSGFVGVSLNAWESGYQNPGMLHDSNKMQFLLRPSETKWLNISLFPRDARALFHGYVNDTVNNPLPGSIVYVQYGDTITTDSTDGSGYYELQVPGDQWIGSWVRAPGYKMSKYSDWINDWENRWYDWTLEGSPTWIEGPIIDSAADLDGDLKYDVLYVNVTVNVAVLGDYWLDGDLAEGRNSNQRITGTGAELGTVLGSQVITLAFMGEQIRNSKLDGYFVDIKLYNDPTWETLDKVDYFTTPYSHDEFEKPNAIIEKPVEFWLVDSDLDGLFNYLILNVTLNVSVEGDYTLLAPMRDIWGTEFEMAFETFYLETGMHEIQFSYDGTSIYDNGETIGSVYLILFEGFPEDGSSYIHSLFLYTPFDYDIFQFYNIDSFVSGYVTDMGNQPIENITVWLYNITSKYLNETKTDAFGYYELGGWSGDWILVVNDDEGDNLYQGDLTEISLFTGTNNYDFLNLPYTQLDQVQMQLIFSDWNNTHLDWLLYVKGDNKTIRFELDVLQFGDGDGFISEEEVDMVMGMLSQMGLPDNSNGSFLVDGIWYDLNHSSLTRDAGLSGPITSTDPVYIHLTGDYTANATISNPSPHDLTLNCTYDDTDSGSFIGNNVTHIVYVVPPSGWGRTGNGVPLNVTISGSDYITVDPLNDPNPGDHDIWEWVNITISIGSTPTYGTVKGNVTLQGSSVHTGVEVTVYDNITAQEVGRGHTDPDGYYEIPGLPPGNYDIIAHKAGYADNWSFNIALSAGEILWLDFSLYSYPPTILHTPITNALLGNTITLTADVTDDGQVDEVTLYYKDVNSTNYSSTLMSRIPSTSTYMGSIPAQSQVGYVYYYIWANDTKGNWAVHPSSGNHSIWIHELDPPDISSVSIVPTASEFPEAVNISAEITDFTSVEVVNLSVEMPDSSTTNTTMEYDTNTGRYYLNISYPMLGTYNFTIWAKDSLDNWNLYSGSFEVLDTIPPASSVTPLATYWYVSSPIIITGAASDSGIGVANVSLYYRYSSDNASWNSWNLSNIDSAAPWSWSFDFPDGEGYYEFFSIAIDDAQNPEIMKTTAETLCGFDPSMPTSSVDIIIPYWHTTITPISINATAFEGVSIVVSVELWYRFSSNNLSWSSWVLLSLDTASPWSWSFDFPYGEGYYEFFSIANDSAGNMETMKVSCEALCGYDYTDPASNVDIIDPYWHTTSTITINSTSSDSVSGVKNVELWYRYSDNNSTWDPWTSFGIDTLEPWSWGFDFPGGEGYYEFFSIASDGAQNTETLKLSSETFCGSDLNLPASSMDMIQPYWQSTSPITITATGSDLVSGLDNIQLLFRYSSDNSSWNSWSLLSIDYASPWSWNFDFPSGEGYYEFNSIAVDISGNTESPPVSADAICAFDTSPPSISSFSAVPNPCELGRIIDIFMVLTDVSGIKGAWVELSFDSILVGNFSMVRSGHNYWYLYTPNSPGIVDIIITVVDNNDNWDSITDSIQVQDTVSPSISNLTITPSSPEIGNNVRLSVDLSDVAGITTYRINITKPNGEFINESMVRISGTDTYYYETLYDIIGEYQFVIWVEDNNSLGVEINDTIMIQDSTPPIANAGPTQDVTVGTTVTLDAGFCSDNFGISNYTWRFNDNGLVWLYGEETNYTFNHAGNYEITLTIRDFGGNERTATTWMNVTAVSGIGTIIGTVLDEDGYPISQAAVYVESSPYIQNYTDSLGRFVLEGVPIGNQTIWIVKDGYQRESRQVTVTQDDTTVVGSIPISKTEKEEPAPLGLYAALAVIAVCAVLLIMFFLMKKKQEKGVGKTVIDEVFFMYNDGRLVKHFTRRLRPDMDEDILSSMLVAVQDFIKDSFQDHEGVLDEMRFGRFQVLLGRGKYIILATIVLGDELEPFRPQVKRCVEDIEEKYAEVLEDWDGNVSKLAGASKYIMDLIDGRYA